MIATLAKENVLKLYISPKKGLYLLWSVCVFLYSLNQTDSEIMVDDQMPNQFGTEGKSNTLKQLAEFLKGISLLFGPDLFQH